VLLDSSLPEFELAFKLSSEGQFISIVLINKEDGSILDESNLMSFNELCTGYNADKPVVFPRMRKELSRYLKDKCERR
jgi:hypothetical protein